MITRNQVKFIKGLSLKKNRVKSQCFVVEGEKSIREVLNSRYEIVDLYATDRWNPSDYKGKIIRISDSQLSRISTLKNPNKVLAIVKSIIIEESLVDGVTLVLDQVKDPGNLGTIIRLCDWFGVQQIVCSKDTVDLYNPKVIQASMGSIFRIKISYTDLPNYLRKVEGPIYGAFMYGSNVKNVSFPDNIHLVLGNESNGISKQVDFFITNKVAVKNIGLSAESLNVAIAAGILLHEICV